tara:strand:- start:67 stop:252 length:186 start_codon:yes stop_codon:yes gene_type:complete
MKTLTKELWMDIPKRRQIVSIHDDVEQLVEESGVTDGLILINAKHIALHTAVDRQVLCHGS